jgi:hypothetical protein
MPYQGVKEDEEVGLETSSAEKPSSEDHPNKGADLLLSLTKTSRNLIVTPVEAAAESGGSFPSSSSSMGPPVAGKHHRLLYHSPIKASNADASKIRCSSDSSSELAPHSQMGLAPAWSPTSFNGMVPVFHASFGPSPSSTGVQKRKMHFDEEECSSPNLKRSRSEVVDTKEPESPEKPSKQRIISPSSSNEKIEGESESTSSQSNLARPWGRPGQPTMYPHWQQPGYPPHMSYPPPPFVTYPPHFPHAWGMFGPSIHPGMYQPPPHPLQKQPTQAAQHKELPATTTEAKRPDAQIDWNFAESSLNRCVPLKHPVMNRHWA